MSLSPLQIENWMDHAIALARDAADRNEVPVACLLVCGDELLASSANAREQRNRVTSHAEIVALETLSDRLTSWRVPNDTWLISTVEPCLMCTGALLHARVDHIAYGCADPKGASLSLVRGEIDAGRFDHRFKTIVTAVKEEECAAVMKFFFRRRRMENKALSMPVT